MDIPRLGIIAVVMRKSRTILRSLSLFFSAVIALTCFAPDAVVWHCAHAVRLVVIVPSSAAMPCGDLMTSENALPPCCRHMEKAAGGAGSTATAKILGGKVGAPCKPSLTGSAANQPATVAAQKNPLVIANAPDVDDCPAPISAISPFLLTVNKIRPPPNHILAPLSCPLPSGLRAPPICG